MPTSNQWQGFVGFTDAMGVGGFCFLTGGLWLGKLVAAVVEEVYQQLPSLCVEPVG